MEKQNFELPNDLTISHLSTFKVHALDMISQSDDIIFMDKALKKIDTVGVQLLLALVNEIITQKKTLTWEISSPILQDSINQLGLDDSDFKNYLQLN
jgi:hypothetical protein